MTFPSPMHYAVAMALEDGLAALDAGKAPPVSSGVAVSLKLRLVALEDALQDDPYHDAAESARREVRRITRLLDGLAVSGGAR